MKAADKKNPNDTPEMGNLHDLDAGRSKRGLLVLLASVFFWLVVFVLCRRYL